MAANERIRTISVGGVDYESELGMELSIHSEPSLMNTSQISTTSSQDSQRIITSSKSPHNLPSKNVSLYVKI